MTRQTTYEDAAPFVAQPSSLENDMGRDIDWENTGDATTIPAGTSMVLIAASGKMCPRLTAPGAETAYGLLAASADMNDRTGHAGHGLITGGVVFENMLPDFNDVAWNTIKAEFTANLVFLTYGDDRT